MESKQVSLTEKQYRILIGGMLKNIDSDAHYLSVCLEQLGTKIFLGSLKSKSDINNEIKHIEEKFNELKESVNQFHSLKESL